MTEQSNPTELARAHAVLEQAVRQSSHPGHVPRASQVRLAMKRLTYDGFDPADYGFKRFRDFLNDAESVGVVTLRDRPGDIEVSLTNPEQGSEPQTRSRVRRDVWRAFVDWNDDASHFYDLADRKVVEVPREPVPLGPARFAEIRARAEGDDAQVIRIPSVPLAEQMLWMLRFTEEVDDASLRGLLTQALAEEHPARSFTSSLSYNRTEQHRWNLYFGGRVLAAVQAWYSQTPDLPEEAVFEPQPEVELSARSAVERHGATAVDTLGKSLDHRESAPRYVNFAQEGHPTSRRDGERLPAPTTGPEGSRMRALIHRAIDRMSDDELRSLRLPVGALVDDV